MRRLLALTCLPAVVAITLSACATGAAPAAEPEPSRASSPASSPGSSSSPASPASSASPTSSAASTAEAPTTADAARALIDELETSDEARPLTTWQTVSVRDTTLVTVGADGREVEAPLPTDVRYVSIAPYTDQTHDCFWHSLATCRGELAGTTARFTITADDGEVLVDQDVPLGANGFAGFWLPAGIAGTITVDQGDRTGSVPFTTTPGSPTCITTLRIS